jgi:phosphoglycolate phosphatase
MNGHEQTVNLIVWDWNGTLIDDAGACVETLNAILSRRGLPAVSCEQYREIFAFPVQSYYARLGLRLSGPQWAELAREFQELYAATSATAPLRAGVREALDRFSAARVPMWILSASEQGFLEGVLRRRAIRHYFGRVYGLDDLYAASKLETGRRLVADAGVPPETVLLVGDTTHDYDVARELGLRCVLVAGGHQARDRLEGRDARVLPGIRSVVDLLEAERAVA